MKFIMLIGLPAAGKSTVARELQQTLGDCVVLSSDAIRKELFGDERVQDDNGRIFGAMHKRTIENLKAGKSVVFDATNIRRKNRQHLLKMLPSNCQKEAIIVWAKVEDCISRDRVRSRTVGSFVISRMLKSFQPPYYDEGWDDIKTIFTSGKYTTEDFFTQTNCNHDNPHHENTVLQHIEKVIKEAKPIAASVGGDDGEALLLAAKYHDVGKKFTKSFTNSRGEESTIAHFYNHQNVGSYLTIGYEEIDSASEYVKRLVCWLVNAHMEPFFNSNYYKLLPEKLSHLVQLLHFCDVAGA